MAHADYIARVEAFSGEPLLVVRVTVQGPKSLNDVEILFSEKGARRIHTRLGVDLNPFLISAGSLSVKIEPDKVNTWTGFKNLRMIDSAKFLPEDFPTADCYLTDGPTFWQLFVNAYPDWHHSKVEVLQGWNHPDMDDLSKFELQFQGILQDITFGPAQDVTLNVRDTFDLKEIEVPTPISDTNLLLSDFTDTDTEMEPTNIDEFPDPENDFPSVDWIAPVVNINIGERNEEEVIFSHINGAGDKLVVAANYVGYSEDLANVLWTTIGGGTITNDSVPGPFGNVNGALVDSNAGGLIRIWLTTVAAASTTFTGSLWLTQHPDDPGALISVIISDVVFGEVFTAAIALTDEWQRVDVTGTFTGAAAGNIFCGYGYAAAGSFKYYATQVQGAPLASKRFYVANAAAPGDALAGRAQYGTQIVAYCDIGAITGGPFQDGETVTQTGSGATGVVVGDTANGADKLFFTVASGTWNDTGLITGGVSGATTTPTLFVDNHQAGETLQEVAEYREQIDETEGFHPIWVARDLLNRALLPSPEFSGLTFGTFQAEADFITSTKTRRRVVDPRSIIEHLSELMQQFLFNMWGDRDGEVKVKLAFRPAPLSKTFQTLSDDEDLVNRAPDSPALSLTSNKESRRTIEYVFYDLRSDASGIPEPGDKPEDFNSVEVGGDVDAEGPNFRSRKIKTIFSKWIFRRDEAIALTGRDLSRFKLGAKIIRSKVRFQRSLDFEIGDTLFIDSRHIAVGDFVAGEAVQAPQKYQAVEINYPPKTEDLEVTFLESRQLRYAHITANGFPDYDAAPEATRDFYGHIGDSDNRVGTNQDDGYYIR